MFKSIVQELLKKSLLEREDLFLTDFEILSGNKIRIVIDGDKGVLVEDCIFISRAIEHNIDRDEYDFSLEVSSAGASAALTIASKLGFPRNLLCIFYIIPTFIRNWVYDYIAKNRYNWYGKKDACMVPTPKLQAKFLTKAKP